MTVITPDSDVILLKVPLEIDDTNQLTFASATAQYNYFYGLTGKKTYDKFTYQRKDGVIRIPEKMDDIITYNYVMYRNEGYSNKWFYAYITGMEYINDSVTAVSIKTDCFQTWQFDLTYKTCLVEREHVNDDTIGLHTLPENVELGDFVANGTPTQFGVNILGVNDWVIVVDVSMIENPGTNQTLTYSWIDSDQSTPTQYVNGIPSGLYHIVIGYNSSATISARYLIDVYDKAGLGNAIQNVYILPKTLVGECEYGLTIQTTGTAPSAYAGGLAMPKQTTDQTVIGTSTYNRPTTINGYTPKNNKLKCWPFNYMNVSNNAGDSASYRYEDFTSGTVSFTVEGALCPSGSVKAAPNNYKVIGANNSYDYGLNGAKYPICAWTTDSYTNWLTQNSVNQNIRRTDPLVGAIKGATAGAAVGGLAGGIVGGIGSLVFGSIDAFRKNMQAESNANMIPDQVHGNAGAGDVVWAKLRSQFTFMPMSIKYEYAKMIDDYFSVTGYKVNAVKTPNVTGRTNWNYVKTVGCYIQADIPQEDLQTIKNMFDKGVTFWHNASTFGDYSQSNAIVTS